MLADEFVELMRQRVPDDEQLKQAGWPKSMWNRVREGYKFELRSQPLVFASDDALIDFINRYETSTLEIGLIRLKNEPKMAEISGLGKAIVFASVDADDLAFLESSREIVMLDSSEPSHVMARVTKNGANFLGVLLLLEESLRKKTAPAESCVQCAELAGVSDSRGFFEMLLM